MSRRRSSSKHVDTRPQSSFSQLWEAAQRVHATADKEGHDEEADEDDWQDDTGTEEDTTPATQAGKRKAQDAVSSASTSPPSRQSRRRRRRLCKPTYLIQKEERELLLDQIRILEARAELLRLKSGLPTKQDKRSLAHLQAENFEMEETIHANLLRFGRCQGMLSCEMNATPVNPMKASIHLPRDLHDRREMLRKLRETRLRRAEEVLAQRLHYLDAFKPYTSEERFVDDAGLFHCKRFDILQFDGLASGRPVYDALLFYHNNIEISMTETLGNLVVREDGDDADEGNPVLWNNRMVTHVTNGYTEEMNIVGFTHYRERDATTDSDVEVVGVIACGSVDEDDLYPYMPSERVRKDMAASYTISECRRKTSGELVVVLKRCVFMAIHPPQFHVPKATLDAMQDDIMKWAPIMVRLVRDKVYANCPRE